MLQFAQHARRRLQSLLPPELEGSELWALLSSSRHAFLLGSRRARLIINRVRLFAFLFAVLTPLWCVVDFLVFEAPLWYYLASLRLATSAAFLVLLLAPTRKRMADAYRAMALLFAIPTLFYIASHSLLAGHQLTDLSEAVATGYAFLPFVLMAGLAIFPLTLKENLMVASVIMGAQLLAGYLNWSTLNWPSFVGGTWLLLLIAAVVMLASLSQLAFMLVLVRQLMHDPLTSTFNRAAGEEICQLYWNQSVRNKQPLSLALLDLDHFKAVNDNHGHEAGDLVLQQFAKCLNNSIRETDILIRWGGEEFVLLLPNTSLPDAKLLLERVREQGFGLRPDLQPLTASIGIAERIRNRTQTVSLLLEKADQRMYQAKRQGRNFVYAGSSHIE